MDVKGYSIITTKMRNVDTMLAERQVKSQRIADLKREMFQLEDEIDSLNGQIKVVKNFYLDPRLLWLIAFFKNEGLAMMISNYLPDKYCNVHQWYYLYGECFGCVYDSIKVDSPTIMKEGKIHYLRGNVKMSVVRDRNGDGYCGMLTPFHPLDCQIVHQWLHPDNDADKLFVSFEDIKNLSKDSIPTDGTPFITNFKSGACIEYTYKHDDNCNRQDPHTGECYKFIHTLHTTYDDIYYKSISYDDDFMEEEARLLAKKT